LLGIQTASSREQGGTLCLLAVVIKNPSFIIAQHSALNVIYPKDFFTFPPGVLFTFPQGESQAGSPGLLAFQSAKSRSDFLSPGF